MNFLAHIYLSGSNEKLMVGNFIGDFIKGNQIFELDEEIQKGVRLHREIDSFTDSHPIVLESKIRLREKFSHYAPVIVDVFYDHFLAKDWHMFSDTALLPFTEQFYQTMAQYNGDIPDAVTHMLGFMSRDNWLYHYQSIEGINRSLTGMSKRTKFDSKMEMAAQSLKAYYESFSDEFHQFFPILQNHVSEYLS